MRVFVSTVHVCVNVCLSLVFLTESLHSFNVSK